MTDLVKMMIGASVGSLITYGIMKSKNEEETKEAVNTAVKEEKKNTKKVTEELNAKMDELYSLQKQYDGTVSVYEEKIEKSKKVLLTSLKDVTSILIKVSNEIEDAEERNRTISTVTSHYAAIIHSDTFDEAQGSLRTFISRIKKIEDSIDEADRKNYINPKRIILNGCGGSKAFVSENQNGFNLYCDPNNISDDSNEFVVSATAIPEIYEVILDSITDQLEYHYLNEVNNKLFREMMVNVPIIIGLKYCESSKTDMYVSGVASLIPFKLFSEIVKTEGDDKTETKFYKIGDDENDNLFEEFVRGIISSSVEESDKEEYEETESEKNEQDEKTEMDETSDVDDEEDVEEDSDDESAATTEDDNEMLKLREDLNFVKNNLSVKTSMINKFFVDISIYDSIDEVGAADVRESIMNLIHDAKESTLDPKMKKFYSNKITYVINKFDKNHGYEIKKYAREHAETLK